MYPTFLQKGLGFSPGTAGFIGVIYNVGSLAGGMIFGTLSERWGRKRAIITAALLAIPIVPLFAYGQTPLWIGVGAFLMQFMVQGAWGVVPAYLTELSPAPVRAIFPASPTRWATSSPQKISSSRPVSPSTCTTIRQCSPAPSSS